MVYTKDQLEALKKKLNVGVASKYKRIREKSLCLSTGIFPIDMAIGEFDEEGYAGIRQRDAFELFGPNNSLKSAVTISMIKETLDRFGPHSVFCIFSEPFDPWRMEQAGIDLDQLLTYEVYEIDEETGEVVINGALAQAALTADLHMCQEDGLMLTIVDAVAALVPELEMYDGKKIRDINSIPIAASAKVMNSYIKKRKNLNKKSVLGMVNHYHEKITSDFSALLMDKSKIQTTGGVGKDFAADVRILCNTTIEMQKENHSVIDAKQGKQYNSTWQLIKNKYCPTIVHRTVKGSFDPKVGKFDNEEKLIEWATFFAHKDNKDVIHSLLEPKVYKNAAHITIGDQKFHGIAKAVEYLRTNKEIFQSLKKQMYPLNGRFFEDVKPSAEEIMETNEMQ